MGCANATRIELYPSILLEEKVSASAHARQRQKGLVANEHFEPVEANFAILLKQG
jgi:hypothetical protein